MLLGFIEIFKNGHNKVLKLRRTLYGLKKIPVAFWEYLVQNMNKCRCKKTNIYP